MNGIKEKKLNIWSVSTFVILAFAVLFIIYPLVLILYKSVISGSGNLSFAYFTKFFQKKYYWSTLINSFKVTIVATLISTLLGLMMAYLLRSIVITGNKYLNIMIVMSYLSPPFIGAYAWIQLLGRNGFITRVINNILPVFMVLQV